MECPTSGYGCAGAWHDSAGGSLEKWAVTKMRLLPKSQVNVSSVISEPDGKQWALVSTGENYGVKGWAELAGLLFGDVHNDSCPSLRHSANARSQEFQRLPHDHAAVGCNNQASYCTLDQVFGPSFPDLDANLGVPAVPLLVSEELKHFPQACTHPSEEMNEKPLMGSPACSQVRLHALSEAKHVRLAWDGPLLT